MLLQEVSVIHFELGLELAELDAGASSIDVLPSEWRKGDSGPQSFSAAPERPEPHAVHGRVAGLRDLQSRESGDEEPLICAAGEKQQTGEGPGSSMENARAAVLVPSPLPLPLEHSRLPRVSVSQPSMRSEEVGPPASAAGLGKAQARHHQDWLEAAERRKQVVEFWEQKEHRRLEKKKEMMSALGGRTARVAKAHAPARYAIDELIQDIERTLALGDNEAGGSTASTEARETAAGRREGPESAAAGGARCERCRRQDVREHIAPTMASKSLLLMVCTRTRISP